MATPDPASLISATSVTTDQVDFHSLMTPELIRAFSTLLASVERPIPLAEFRDRLMRDYKSRKRNTRIRMAQALKEALALAGANATTRDLTAELVHRFGERSGECSTTNGLLSSLRTACRWAVRWKLLDPSRLEASKWVIRPKRVLRRKHHPRADVLRVLDSLKSRSQTWEGGRLYSLASVYAYTGIRKSEALMLKVEDVDLKRGFLFVLPNGQELKTEGSAAPVPCPRALIEILRGWVSRCRSDWLFPKMGLDGPWKAGCKGKRPTDRLVAAGEAVGVEGFTPLSLRHSLATHFASFWGLSDKQIQLILRHTTVLTQRIYIHPDLVNLGELVRDFDFSASPPRANSTARADSPHPMLRGRKRRRPHSLLIGS